MWSSCKPDREPTPTSPVNSSLQMLYITKAVLRSQSIPVNLALQLCVDFKTKSYKINRLFGMGIQWNSFDFHKLLQGLPSFDSRFDFLPDHLNPDAAFDGCDAYIWWSHEPPLPALYKTKTKIYLPLAFWKRLTVIYRVPLSAVKTCRVASSPMWRR